MLGFKLKPSDWQWAAHGKLPAARDFFTVGHDSPIFKAFFAWLDQGCQQLNDRQALEQNCSWRFWVRGGRKHELLCGIIKNSSDQIGRPYPLMLIGAGSLKNWEKQWNTIPDTCEGLWNQLEYLTTRRYDGLEQLTADLRLLKPREGDVNRPDRIDCGDFRGEAAWLDRLRAEQKLFLPLGAGGPVDPNQAISCLHEFFKKNQAEIPNSIFLGGRPENLLFVIFNKGLATEDFLELWQ